LKNCLKHSKINATLKVTNTNPLQFILNRDQAIRMLATEFYILDVRYLGSTQRSDVVDELLEDGTAWVSDVVPRVAADKDRLGAMSLASYWPVGEVLAAVVGDLVNSYLHLLSVEVD